MEKITLYENQRTGELLNDQREAIKQWRAGDDIKVFFQHNIIRCDDPKYFIIWQH